MSLLSAKNRGMAHGLKAASYFFLLIFYVTCTSQFEVLHHVFHSHDSLVSHSAEEEKDACHRAVYHHETEQKCDHSHIVVADKCELCDLISHTEHVLFSSLSSPSIKFFVVDFVFNLSHVVGTRQSIDSSRAPPAV
jgi:hypothetical protein